MNDNPLILPGNRSKAWQEDIQPETGLLAVVPVLKPDDVLLTEVVPRLHLDGLQRRGAWNLEARSRSQGDESRLVLGKRQHRIAASDAGGAGNLA